MGSDSIGAILLQKEFLNPFDEACLLCEPCHEANRIGLLGDRKDGISIDVCYSEVPGIPFAQAFRSHYNGGEFSSCIIAHGCLCLHF